MMNPHHAHYQPQPHHGLGMRTKTTDALKKAYVRRAADANAVGSARLLEPREGAQMAQLNLNFERAARR